eukprot:4464259-Pyramimonas_sp.AAC.1
MKRGGARVRMTDSLPLPAVAPPPPSKWRGGDWEVEPMISGPDGANTGTQQGAGTDPNKPAIFSMLQWREHVTKTEEEDAD